jgi:diacylglycerol diphosphate phosphatase/phosphatidate phosphatase
MFDRSGRAPDADDNRFLAGQLHVFRPRTDLARVLIALAPLLGALLIAVSRLEDYRHDVYDVTCGSILGISVAYFSYRRYYPSLRTKNCDVPYPSRAESLSVNGFAKVKDEEERVGDALEFTLDDLGEEEESYPLNELGSRDGS